ncbi:hypothetical protein M422DRAFT_160818 [Sphaerobolus stellatus SS14]|nr:hypothetical protein M422DRAFT_160818 [Sphaerobolus stellatus SS14]
MDVTKQIPVYHTVNSYREWRENARKSRKSVGYVATMGALHEGHLSLVERSLKENDLTVVSVFVNPAQFAPHEDLDSYPRTLPVDLEKLSGLAVEGDNGHRKPAAVFAPSVAEMYPNGIERSVEAQKGTFVEVKGYSHQMEGSSRPHFFRGVATVVTKLFNVIEPTQTYFGQKDIQQALLLRRMCADLLLNHPKPENLHIVPTSRASSGLALSSRNAYLSNDELPFAVTLYEALSKGAEAWKEGLIRDAIVQRAVEHVSRRREQAQAAQVELKLDYVEVNDPETFGIVADSKGKPAILSGAIWVGRTRLIDNILLGQHAGVLS